MRLGPSPVSSHKLLFGSKFRSPQSKGLFMTSLPDPQVTLAPRRAKLHSMFYREDREMQAFQLSLQSHVFL